MRSAQVGWGWNGWGRLGSARIGLDGVGSASARSDQLRLSLDPVGSGHLGLDRPRSGGPGWVETDRIELNWNEPSSAGFGPVGSDRIAGSTWARSDRLRLRSGWWIESSRTGPAQVGWGRVGQDQSGSAGNAFDLDCIGPARIGSNGMG